MLTNPSIAARVDEHDVVSAMVVARVHEYSVQQVGAATVTRVDVGLTTTRVHARRCATNEWRQVKALRELVPAMVLLPFIYMHSNPHISTSDGVDKLCFGQMISELMITNSCNLQVITMPLSVRPEPYCIVVQYTSNIMLKNCTFKNKF